MGSGTGVTQLGVVCTSYHTLNLTGPSYIWSENYCFDDEITKVTRTGHRRHRTAMLYLLYSSEFSAYILYFQREEPPPKKKKILTFKATHTRPWRIGRLRKLTLVTA